MRKLEMEFFEEYRLVDNICKDMFQSKKGVTEYIEQMEAHDAEGFRQVANWNEKYKMLKHLRWLRNQIAHENGAPDLEEHDLGELQRFHKQLLNRRDPLSALRQARAGAKRVGGNQKNSRARTRAEYEVYNIEVSGKKKINPLALLLLIGVLACVVVWLMG
ncbi:MAG: hypothetical protein K6B67_02185 [Lachnospiraceae bacterium]|nr:hypothetical protein [Lachnospiraceae bacterium]